MYRAVIVVESETSARACARALLDLPGVDTRNGDESATQAILVHVGTNPSLSESTDFGVAQEARRLLADHGIETDVMRGDSAQAVLKTAATRNADLIVVGGRKRSPAGKALFGSLTQDIVLNAERSVLVASPSETSATEE